MPHRHQRIQARTAPWPALLPATLAALLAAPAAHAQICPARPYWPTHDWRSRVNEVAASHQAEIDAFEAYAFTLTGEDAERTGVRTDGAVIIRGGVLIYERYARDFDAGMRHLAWSVTKSVTNALTGIAVARGAIALDDPICDHLDDVPEENCAITVQDLLEFASGLDWAEVYEDQGNQASSVLAMLYGEGHRDMVGFVSGHQLRDAPGTTFDYSSGDAVALAGVIDEVLRPGLGENYAWPLLFDVLGMRSVTMERDNKGIFVGASYLYATPRDLARFGFLFLNDGCWDDQRLLPEGWVEDSTRVSEPYKRGKVRADEDGVQGRHWWLNREVPEQGVSLPLPDVPDDAYMASGHWGQYIVVIPSLDLVVVRTGDDRDGTFNLNRFTKLAIAVAE